MPNMMMPGYNPYNQNNSLTLEAYLEIQNRLKELEKRIKDIELQISSLNKKNNSFEYQTSINMV